MATNQEYAYLAEDAYKTLEPGIRDLKKLKPRVVGGREYFVLEHADYRGTHDYQGTIYMDAQTHEIIVAHRGTWSVSDVGVDLEMVRRQSNRQLPHAMALVEHAKALAREWNADNPNEQVPNISVTARTDPAPALRRRDPGGDRRQHHRPRECEGAAQERAGQVLRRRHHAEEEAA